MKKNTAVLVNAALAGLLATGGLFSMTAKALAADGVECSGINACKGKGECGGSGHACGGKNECKGKGWVKKASAEECAKAGGTVVTKGEKTDEKKPAK